MYPCTLYSVQLSSFSYNFMIMAGPKPKPKPKRPSRNSTPSPEVKSERMERSISPYISTSMSSPSLSNPIPDFPITALFDQHTGIPSASSLAIISETIQTSLLAIIKARDEVCDKLMRELAIHKKERAERNRLRELELAKEGQLKKSTTPKMTGKRLRLLRSMVTND